MRVIESIKEIRGCTPRQLVFNVRMTVLCNRRVGLFVITIQGEEIVTALVSDLASDGGLTAHRINRHGTAVQIQQAQNRRNGGNLVRFGINRGLGQHEPALLCPR